MHEIIHFLKAAVDRSEGSGVYGCYLVRDGMIMARNMHLQAGFPMSSKVPFNIPADELDRALGRMQNVDKLVIKDGEVRITAGRLKATIQVNTSEAMGAPELADDWLPMPEGFTTALQVALPFIGDRDYTKSIQLHDNRVGAISGQRAVGIDLPGLVMPHGPIMMTPEVAQFFVDHDVPHEYRVREDRVQFMARWNDGRWVIAQLLNYGAPDDKINDIFAKVGDDAPVIIDDAWRAAYEDAKALSHNGGIALSNKALHVQGKHSKARVDHETPGLSPEHFTYWDCKLLDAIVAVSHSWNPNAYPSPVPFFGKGLKGVVMGMSRWKS